MAKFQVNAIKSRRYQSNLLLWMFLWSCELPWRETLLLDLP